MKIAIFEAREREQEELAQLLPEHELFFYEEKLGVANVEKVKSAEVISVFVGSEIRKEIIDLLPNLKLITTRSTGFDHIDINYAAGRGVMVASVPAYGSRTVAEFSFGLLLNLSRNVCLASARVRGDKSFGISGLRGFDLYGKTLGVIGTGRIGKNMVRIANGFDMKVLATDIYPDNNFAEEKGFEYVPLTALLSSSDVVTLHTPYNETTHHLINAENIKFMKKGAFLINTARGEIVDTKALVAALKTGDIAGAGLDVLEEERNLREGKGGEMLALNRELIDMPNVIVTPHIAFFSVEAEAEIIKTTADNIKSFAGGNPQNIIEVKK